MGSACGRASAISSIASGSRSSRRQIAAYSAVSDFICRQPGSRRLRALDKQPHRIRLGEGFEDVLLLGADLQRRAAGDEHRQRGAGGQQLRQQRRGRDDVLEVVEH